MWMLDRKLSLVLPAHNEADNIEAVVSRAVEVLSRVTPEYEIIVVNDGSVDGTADIVERLAATHDHVRGVHHPVNRGYGAALISGFQAATGDAVMFMDSDQQFDIAEITALLPYVPHHDIVAGYRIRRQDPMYRRLYGKLFGIVVTILFGLRMRDIDCAFKILRADLLKDVQLTTPGALINTELLVRSKRRGANIVQVGVHHYPRHAGESSGGSPRVVLRAMGETVRLWVRLRREEPQSRITSVSAAHDERDRVFPRAAVVVGFTLCLAILMRIWRRSS
jgi:glycosyltransferase involved in cell wall biosynthesis